MKASIGLPCLAALATAFVFLGQAQAAPEPSQQGVAGRIGPRLAISPETAEWDIGEVWYGAPLQKDFWLYNTGDAKLIITEVKTSCHCTAAEPEKKELEPGDKVKLTLSYDATVQKYKISQYVKIFTNEGPDAKHSIALRGSVRPMFEFSPSKGPALGFGGDLDREKPQSQTLKIKNLYTEPVHLKLKDEKAGDFKLVLKELEPGQEYELVATTVPPLAVGMLRAQAILLTGLEHPKELPILLHGIIMPPVTISNPAHGVLYISPKITMPTTRRVVMNVMPNDPTKIVDVKCDDERVTWKVIGDTSVGRGRTIAYEITAPPGSAIPAEGVKVRFITDNADEDFREVVLTITNDLEQAKRLRSPASLPGDPEEEDAEAKS